MKSIYLCGFMGCGKTTIGKRLANSLGYGFVDLDSYIVMKEGMTIPQIFEKKGEPYFRELEKRALIEFSDKGNTVIATGGGALANKQNGDIIRENSIIIYLKLDFNICYERIKRDKNRPLVVNNTKEQLFNIYNQRDAIYSENATFTYDVNKSPMQCAKEISEAIKNRLN